MRTWTKIIMCFVGDQLVIDEARSEWFDYDGPVALCKGPSANETKAYSNADADRASSAASRAKAGATFNEFEGNPEDTGFYKNTVTNGLESTSRNYDDMRASSRMRAKMAGFGYDQPIGQSNETGINEDEHRDLADVPRQALASTYDKQMQVAGAREGEAGDLSGSAQGYFKAGNDMENQRLARRNAMFQSLIKAGTSIATGGMSSYASMHPGSSNG